MNPKQDCELLLNEVLPFAKRMLEEHAEFYPFGGMLRRSGEVANLSARIEGESHPKSRQIIHLLRERLRHEANSGSIIASAVVFNMGNILDPESNSVTDAIKICLDHVENYSIELLLPYNLESGREPLYGKLFAQKGESHIFTGHAD